MTKIDSLTGDEILNEVIPINDLLENSFYYPASYIDGEIVRIFSKEIQSFIYCDYFIKERSLRRELITFKGYKLIAHRSVKKEELIPEGWQEQPPPNFDINEYNMQNVETPFAHWAVYERLEDFDENHGANRFSLLYIGGEGVATYQALYWANKKTAKALAIKNPNLNWTHDFHSNDGPLAWVVSNNPYGTPSTIFCDSGDFNWKGYTIQEIIDEYRFTIWKKADND